ncbi:MAG: hypothetical protein Q7J34_08405 [Bacteroidales bacterium]|nr:hypothetical protein [Bacteroidales bacterium]
MPHTSNYKYLGIIVLLTILSFNSCKKESYTPGFEERLKGHYINPQYSDQKILFEKSHKLKEKVYGISLLDNHQCVERRNIGFCGTPPVVFDDYHGEWTLADSVLSLRLESLEGIQNFHWKILLLDNKHLLVEILQ